MDLNCLALLQPRIRELVSKQHFASATKAELSISLFKAEESRAYTLLN